jgi:hypothetical protein
MVDETQPTHITTPGAEDPYHNIPEAIMKTEGHVTCRDFTDQTGRQDSNNTYEALRDWSLTKLKKERTNNKGNRTQKRLFTYENTDDEIKQGTEHEERQDRRSNSFEKLPQPIHEVETRNPNKYTRTIGSNYTTNPQQQPAHRAERIWDP